MKKNMMIVCLLSLICCIQAQIGDVIWEDNFDNLDNWMIITGNGSWGWGNGELEYYHENNVEITEIPGDTDNNALKITARNETGAGIVDQWGNPLSYTSGKVSTKSFISLQYGVVEARVKVPNIDLGGWPAVWMLGTSNLGWPRCGEIDMMEMGARQSFRDLHDSHNNGNNSDNATVNQAVSANAIFYSEEAVVPDNPNGAASLSWDPNDESCRPYYSYVPPLTDRFLIYRTYWDESSLRFTVIDNGNEYDLYEEDFMIDSTSTEFNNPFYLIANLAIGGAYTDAYTLGDPSSGAPISMPFPAEMYVDYIKVMEWNGQGEVHIGPPTPQHGTYGIFTDNTPTHNSLVCGDDAEIYVWEETLSQGSLLPYEGENGISWTTNGLGWFGAGIMSMQPVNLFNYGQGHLKFMVKIPTGVTFKIGIIDTWGNQNYVTFPANQPAYGLQRTGEWEQATIPVEDLRGLYIDLRMLTYEFVILEESGVQCEFAIDDIYWDGAPVDNIYYWKNPTLAGTDASLSDLLVDGTTIDGFSSGILEYDIELEAGTTTVPTVTATTTDPNASYQVTAATELPGSTTVLVTSDDENVNRTYTINFTLAPSITEPTEAAPTPTKDAENVLSVYGGSYTQIPGVDLNPFWGQSTVQSFPLIAGNEVLQMDNFNYQGIQYDNLDATQMEYVHIDVWTVDAPSFQITPISPGSEAVYELSPVLGQWNSYDIALTEFPCNFAELFQFKFDGTDGSTVFIDNLYYWKNPTVEGADASLSDLLVDGSTVTAFNSSTYTYAVELPEGTTIVPTVTATTTDIEATLDITPATELPGTTTIDVTSANGLVDQTYSIEFTVAGPAPASEYCNTYVTHFNIEAEVASAIYLTISNIDETSMYVEIESANDDPVDLLLVNNFSGGALAEPDTSVPGKIRRVLSWVTAPTDVDIQLLWSKDSMGGNWMLDTFTVPFAATCQPSTELDIPQNVDISIIGSDVTITWTAVDGADTYTIYSCDTPNGTYEIDESGTLNGTSWTATSTTIKFYKVVANSN